MDGMRLKDKRAHEELPKNATSYITLTRWQRNVRRRSCGPTRAERAPRSMRTEPSTTDAGAVTRRQGLNSFCGGG